MATNKQINPRKQEPYIRLLELMSVITEEWGETVKDVNNFMWKGFDTENVDKALKELQQLKSPLEELEGVLNYAKVLHGKDDNDVK